MTDKQTEKLVKLIHSGKNTYADIHACFPSITDKDLQTTISGEQCPLYSNKFPPHAPTSSYEFAPLNLDFASSTEREWQVLRFVTPPNRFWRGYVFHNDERFVLSETGKNLLYKIQKREKQFTLTVISIFVGGIAAIASVGCRYRGHNILVKLSIVQIIAMTIMIEFHIVRIKSFDVVSSSCHHFPMVVFIFICFYLLGLHAVKRYSKLRAIIISKEVTLCSKQKKKNKMQNRLLKKSLSLSLNKT